MKNIVSITFILLIVFACKTTNKKQTQIKTDNSSVNMESLHEKQTRGVDFCAFGNDQSWNLEIDYGNYIKFKTSCTKGSFYIPENNNYTVDGDTIKYVLKNGKTNISILISKKHNPFNLQENEKPYSVFIEMGKNKKTYSGQGEFFADLKLHKKWLLQKINNKHINAYENNEEAFIEFYLNNYTMNGFLGCNAFSGSVSINYSNTIVFSPISKTKKGCIKNTTENDFSDALASARFEYIIKGDSLELKNKDFSLIFIQDQQ